MARASATALLVALIGAWASMGSAPMAAKFDVGTLVNSAGMTLYTYDRNAAGSSKRPCKEPCAVNWSPLGAAAADSGSGEWPIVVRNDGSRQWTNRGKPSYLWITHRKHGDGSGDAPIRSGLSSRASSDVAMIR